jgi:hypothetical protein
MFRCLRTVAMALAFGLFYPTSVRGTECDALAAQLVVEIGASLDRRSSSRVILRHPQMESLSVGCLMSDAAPALFNPDLFVSYNGAFPPAAFFKLASRAGQIVTGAKSELIERGSMRCHRAALRARDELADLKIGQVSFECQAFTRDDGATSIKIFRQSRK